MKFTLHKLDWRIGSGDVVADVLDCDNVIRRFELQSLYYVHFRVNNLWDMQEHPYLPRSGWIVPLKVFYKNDFWD